MNRSSRIACLLTLFVFCAGIQIHAQNITGIWRGYFITEGYDQYKFELQVKQTGSSVTGVSYSYLSTVFYGKATLTGMYSRSGQNALIQEIKTVELKMSGGSQACIMKCNFKYSRSGNEEFLEGIFTSKYEKDGLGNKMGENCGGGKVFLRKVTTSDFYIEPFLRGKVRTTPVIVNQPPTKKITEKKNPITPTTPRKDETKNPPEKKPVVKTPPAVKDTIKKITQPVVRIKPPVAPTPAVLKDRSNELVRTITVHNPEVVVKFYDNGEIDDDTISVYFNNQLVLASKRLTASALVLKLSLDPDESDHELIMVADNLGRIPPNTSLMIVESGGERFDVRITSTEQKNALVRFKYQKPN